MQPVEFEKIILKILFENKDIRDKILPFLDGKIFDDFNHKEIVKSILVFEQKFSKFPSISDMKLGIDNQEVYKSLVDIVNLNLQEFSSDSLIGEVEDFFKKKLIWNVTADIVENLKDDKISKISMAPESLRQALAFNFNTNIGFNLLEDYDRYYDYIHGNDSVIPTGLSNLDSVIGGGIHPKTLTIFVASANVGKTIFKCSIAANMLMQNKNVLYITLEMSEEMIAERIYQNIFDFSKEDLTVLTREKFNIKIDSIKKKLKNSLFIKEYPNKGANVNTIKNLLKELEIKKKFIPHCIFIDYIGILAPIYMLKSDNSYTEGKRVSEEVRGLGVDKNTGMVSSWQGNRSSFDEVITSMSDMADSIGPAATGDVIMGISQTEEMRAANRFGGILLKNRYGINKVKLSFDITYDKMRVTNPDKEEDNKKEPSSLKKAIDLTANEIKKESDNEKKRIISFDLDEDIPTA
jgi:replicative DNA helicase